MSELARKLIAENKPTRAKHLDLGNCGLESVPAEVAELHWLESITFASDWSYWDGQQWQQERSQNEGEPNGAVEDLCQLDGLTDLTTLVLAGTKVDDLTPLAGLSALTSLDLRNTQVADLTPLAGLSALSSLDVWDTQVADLTPLARLSDLITLDLGKTQVADLTPLAGLSALTLLNAFATRVADLTPLAELTGLITLNVSHTQVAHVNPLAGLTTLTTLSVAGTQVADLAPLLEWITTGIAVKWSEISWGNPGLYVENCPLTSPPPDIVRRGNEAILNYFKEKAAGEVDQLYEAKMLILSSSRAAHSTCWSTTPSRVTRT